MVPSFSNWIISFKGSHGLVLDKVNIIDQYCSNLNKYYFPAQKLLGMNRLKHSLPIQMSDMESVLPPTAQS